MLQVTKYLQLPQGPLCIESMLKSPLDLFYGDLLLFRALGLGILTSYNNSIGTTTHYHILIKITLLSGFVPLLNDELRLIHLVDVGWVGLLGVNIVVGIRVHQVLIYYYWLLIY